MGSCGKGFGRGRRSCFLIWVFVSLGLSSLWGSGCAQVETREAESAELLGSAALYDDPVASGGQGVAYISSEGAGFRFEEVPASAGFAIEYASELSGSLSIWINGAFAGTIDFVSTGAWVGGYEIIARPLQIPAGASFEMRFAPGDTAMNVDTVRFLSPRRLAFGIDAAGQLFHVDEGWSASFQYLCVNGNCLPGERTDGLYRRNIESEVAIGQTVFIEFKVEDQGGQCLTGEVAITRTPEGSVVESACAQGANVALSPPELAPAPTPVPETAPDPVPAPVPVSEPLPDTSPETPPAEAPPASPLPTGQSQGDGAGLISFDGETIITRFAERFRDRHESDLNHDVYINEYADGSAYEVILIDHLDRLEVQLYSPQTPLSMVNFTHDHIVTLGFADPPQYRGGGFMAKGSPDGPANDDPNFLVSRLFFEIRFTNGRPWSEVRADQEMVTIEFTPRRPLNGGQAQYYSDIFRYRAGQGGITFERDESKYFSAGPTTNFPHGSPGFEFSQPYLGIDQPSLHRFTLGRELFRASFLGDSLPGNGGQATGADPSREASACVNCHFQLGKAAPPGRAGPEQEGFNGQGRDLRVAPSLIGLGLLEAVDRATLVALAEQSGGRLSEGRFGWKASEPTLRSQILQAFAEDMGVQAPSPVFVDRVEEYIQGLGVPIRRHPSARTEQSPNVALRVPDAQALADPEILDGEAVFVELGCNFCHVPTLPTGDSHPIEQFRNLTIRPFTDLLLWDMGPELCAESGEGAAGPCDWRTAPLWGLGLHERVTGHSTFLHDGRARTIDEAIRWHGGDALRSRDLYESLSDSRRMNLLLYLMSL